MRTKTKLEIPVLVLDPVLDPLDLDPAWVLVREVEIDAERIPINRESLSYVRRMLKEEWDLKNVRRITLAGLPKLGYPPSRRVVIKASKG
jgi:hypothetical protein